MNEVIAGELIRRKLLGNPNLIIGCMTRIDDGAVFWITQAERFGEVHNTLFNESRAFGGSILIEDSYPIKEDGSEYRRLLWGDMIRINLIYHDGSERQIHKARIEGFNLFRDSRPQVLWVCHPELFEVKDSTDLYDPRKGLAHERAIA